MPSELWGIQTYWQVPPRQKVSTKEGNRKSLKEKQEMALSRIAEAGKQEILSFAYPEKYTAESKPRKMWVESRKDL